MPNSLDAALVFALLIVPGYQLVRGYAVASGADAPDRDLYVLAQAVVASLVWLALTWPAVRNLLIWVGEDALGDHLLCVYLIAPLVVGLPYLVGSVGGSAVKKLAAPRGAKGPTAVLRFLSAVGIVGRGTSWDRVWLGAIKAGRAVATVDLVNGKSIVGQFASNSFVAASPAAPAVFFERAYEVDANGTTTTFAAGAFIDAAQIVAIKFNRIG
ncbi:MAG TPA: DUF6338 family protein [Solirubrobacterales bacterium]|nr:DUF6338 family protein [Solirubrobacterales bacterium]